MNDPASFRPSEIALAYERHFAPLEAARKEYAEAVQALLRELDSHVRVATAECFEPPFRVESSIETKEFESAVACRVHVGEIPSGFWVLASPAAPKGGTAGFLRIEAFGWFDEKAAPAARDQTFDPGGEFPGSDRGSGLLCRNEVPFAEHGVDAAAAAVIEQLRRLLPYAEQQVEEESTTKWMIQALREVLVELGPSAGVTDPAKGPKSGCWLGLHFAQAVVPGQPDIWVGYHPQTVRLIYGHHKHPTDPSFQQRFYSAVGAGEVSSDKPFSFGDSPAGVILQGDALKSKSVQELKTLVAEVFRRYFEMHGGSAPNASNADTPTIPA